MLAHPENFGRSKTCKSNIPGIFCQLIFSDYLIQAFDLLYQEGKQQPKMMSIGLHTRISGKPGRAADLARFLDYVCARPGVWVTRRVDIARHWHRHFSGD